MQPTLSKVLNNSLMSNKYPSLLPFEKWYEAHEGKILSDFFTFLKFPSISTDAHYKFALEQTAEWLIEYLKKIEFKAERWDTKGSPIVFATNMQAGKDRPTVLIYHHYDVQPVDPLEKWKSPPFEPVIREGNVYARGASDNKGQCFYTLTSLKAFAQLSLRLGVNIKLIIEGEEECGSQGVREILKRKKKELQADYLLIVDMGIPSFSVPAITLGLRGITTMEVQCQNARVDLHSGVHGGIVLNPNRALIEVLSQLWDKKGKIAIPGFYRDVKMPSKKELAKVNQSFSEKKVRKNFGIQAFQKERGWTSWEANAIRPTLEINGISGGYTGLGFKTVIPSIAVAKISCRLVPDQNPDQVAQSIGHFLKKNVAKGIELTYIVDSGGKAVRTSPDNKIAKICAEAFEEVFQKPCQNIFCGASVPIVAELQKASSAEVAMIGVALSEDDFHAPNEHFGLKRFYQGFLIMSSILQKFG